MSYEGKNDHDIFMKSVNSEIKDVKIAYEKAQKAYESVLKKFLIRNVTGKKHFKHFHDCARSDVIDYYDYQPGSWAVDELKILHFMVDNHCSRLLDGRCNAIDREPLSECRTTNS